MKYFYSICIFSLTLFSCTKSEESTKKPGPVSISISTDTSVKYFVQNTDIPILLDSATLNFYSMVDINSNNYFVEKIPINKGTSLEQFSKSQLTFNPQNTIYNNNDLAILHNWSTRFQTQNFTSNSYTSNQNINTFNYLNNIIVTNGVLFGFDATSNMNVVYPSRNTNKLFITKNSLDGSILGNTIRLFAIKKNSIVSNPPSIKNYDGRMIPFSESNNYYYIYFYPMTSNSVNLSTIFKDLLFYNNLDFYSTISNSIVNNFIRNGYERVFIVEYIKDSNGKNIYNSNSLIRSNNLY